MTIRPMSRLSASRIISHTFRLALEYHIAGFLLDAAELYAEICALDPFHADSLFLLGVIARQTKRFRHAARLVSEAIALRPGQGRFRRELELIRTLENEFRARARNIYPGNTSTPSGESTLARVCHVEIVPEAYPMWIPTLSPAAPSCLAAHA